MIDLKALWANHRLAVGGGGVASAAALALIVKRRNAAAAKATPAGAAATTTTAIPSPGDAYQSVGSDVYNSIQPEIQALQASIAGLQGGGTAPVAAPNPPPPTPASPAPPPPAPAPPPVAAPAAPPPPQTYTVKPGDTLWGIATALEGGGNNWQKIYNANKGVIGGNPNLIKPGQVLTIPH